MNSPRRDFLKTSLAASTAAVLAQTPASALTPIRYREYYDLRCYRLKSEASAAALDGYLEKALLPALVKRSIVSVGVFTEKAPKDPKDALAVWVLIPHPHLESFEGVSSAINADPAVIAAGADYFGTPMKEPVFDRIDSWLLFAFSGMSTLELQTYSHSRQPRILELRTYESHNEVRALKKVAMFNDGEIEVMKNVGLAPVFFGQALTGQNLPHLTYMLSAKDEAAHKQHWDAFRANPTWNKMKNDPQYADTVSKITSRIFTPKAYSRI